ncbi:hypothetical protein Btru_048272 [Bulinus truncatus]|nr:hypothetical protein Btru_048272 [Bulinus truncatus]
MSRGRLKPEDHSCIQSNYRFLKEQLEALDLVDYLFECGVLTVDHKETIRKESNRLERNEILLTILLNAGPEFAFNHFLRSLENNYSFVLEHLKRTAQSIQEVDDHKTQIQSLKDELVQVHDKLEKKTEEVNILQDQLERSNAELESLRRENEKLKEAPRANNWPKEKRKDKKLYWS